MSPVAGEAKALGWKGSVGGGHLRLRICLRALRERHSFII
jgi:hypothetical protein